MKKVPEFKSDSEAKAFLEQDLSDLDFTQFKHDLAPSLMDGARKPPGAAVALRSVARLKAGG